MLNLIDITNTIESVSTDFPPETVESQTEPILREQIANLWSAHLSAKNTARATNEELRALRAKLGEQLSEMKETLASPGREGRWSSFLREHGIPRATADRLVKHHEAALNPNINCTSEADSEPTDEKVQKLFRSWWPKLCRVLRTPQSRYRFIDLFASHYECREVTDRGILFLKPAEPIICPSSSDGQPVGEPELDAAPLVIRADQELI
jgi:hypothetical protein